MKTVLALVIFSASFASAVSMKPYDKWSCYFSYKNTGMIRGVHVHVNYDLMKNQGSAVSVADCPACHVLPLELSVTRETKQNTVFFRNFKNNFDLRIFWSPTTRTGTAWPATYNNYNGTCNAVN